MIFVISEWFNKCVYLMINWEECCNKVNYIKFFISKYFINKFYFFFNGMKKLREGLKIIFFNDIYF